MAGTITEKDPSAEELVIVETPPKADAAENSADAPNKEDSRLRSSAHDDDHEDEDAPVAGESAEQLELRNRRRLEKMERKQRREAAIRRDKTELDFLRQRNEDLERRFSVLETRSQQADLAGLDATLRQANTEYQMAEQVIAKAVAAGNGEDVAQALRYRDQAAARIHQLNAAKQNAARASAQPAAPVVDKVVLDNAREFMTKHDWYDPQGRDEDSAIVLAIDQRLAAEGYNPASADYWSELDKRVARRLPERASGKADEPTRSARGGPNLGGASRESAPSGRREVYISPERKQALVEAGVWDDPVLRAKYVRRYAEYDKTNRA